METNLIVYGTPFSTLCRTCLQVSHDMRPLHNPETVQMLMDCAPLQVFFPNLTISHGDGMPSLICEQCLKQVNKSYTFKKLCERSDNTLKQYILHGYIPNEFTQPESGVNLIDNNNCSDSLTAMILENLNENDELFDVSPHLTTLSGSQSEDEDPNGLVDHSIVDLEPECNLIINLQDDSDRTNLPVDDTSWLQQTITIINNETTEVVYEPFAKSKPATDPPIVSAFDDLGDFFPCSVENCEDSFRCLEDLNIHMSIHWCEEGYKCNVCSKKFSQMPTLKKHIRTHMSWKAHKCEICSKEFTDSTILDRHLKKHDETSKNKKFKCEICGQGYADNYRFNIHLKKHTGEKPFVCDICYKPCSDRRLLISHLKSHKKEKSHKCTECDKSFIHSSTLYTHMRTHTGEKPFTCNVCGKKFAQCSNLSLHMRSHTGIKPYPCSMCNKSFVSSSKLVSHIQIHTGEKPYSCTVCLKAFARPKDAKSHMRIHTGEKPYACSKCDKRFTTASHRKRHETLCKPHPCDVCGETFLSIVSLRKHKRTHDNKND